MVYITFVILIVERVLESYNSSLRKPLRQIILSAIEKQNTELKAKIEEKDTFKDANPSYSNEPRYNDLLAAIYILENEAEDKNKELMLFKHETRKTLLIISVVLGGLLSAMGCLNVFSPFIDETLFVGVETEGIHRAIFDGICVVVSGWIVAGGSEGWNSVTSWVEGSINPRKP